MTPNGAGLDRSRALIALLAMTAAIGLVSIAPAKAQVLPPTLSGEALVGSFTMDPACTDVASGTYVFSSSGNATGPYPGTYQETGTLTVSSLGLAASFSADFSVTSGSTVITGTKTGSWDFGTPVRCLFGIQFHLTEPQPLTYTATITTPEGVYTDSGTSNLVVNSSLEPDFSETFNSAQTAPTPVTTTTVEPTTTTTVEPTTTTTVEPTTTTTVEPTTTTTQPPVPTNEQQCRDQGWRNYPHLGFKNQGDCISYIRTQGRNEPGQD